MKTPSFEELQQMDDASIGEVLGHTSELERFRSGLDDIAKLEGSARKEAEQELQRMLEPNVHASEPGWIAEDAKRKQAKSGQEELQDGSPSSVI